MAQYVSLVMLEPSVEVNLSEYTVYNELHVMDVTCDVNGFPSDVHNLLFDIEETAYNEFVHPANLNNTKHTFDLPIPTGVNFNYHKALTYPDWAGRPLRKRKLRVRILEADGTPMSSVRYNNSELHIKLLLFNRS